MKILTVNTGSSSVRLALFSQETDGPRRIFEHHVETDTGTPEVHLKAVLEQSDHTVDIIAHRIVHGGKRFTGSCLITEEVEEEIEAVSPRAPLHNPVALSWVRACRTVFGNDRAQIGVFDTAFFSSLPDVSRIYALPKDLCRKHGIIRYGYHGLAHRGMTRQWNTLRPDLKEGGRVISLQLGSGASITAVKEGRPVDTSMGFSPLEGLMMSTRPGDVDPGVIVYLQKSAGLSIDDIDRLLNRSSGLSGVSAISGDMRDLLQSDAPDAALAVELYCYRARKYIGAYLAALSGADGIIFGGGIGENAPLIRKKILDTMQWCGIELDDRINNSCIGMGGQINSEYSKVDVRVLPVDEAILIAEEACSLVL